MKDFKGKLLFKCECGREYYQHHERREGNRNPNLDQIEAAIAAQTMSRKEIRTKFSLTVGQLSGYIDRFWAKVRNHQANQ